MTSRYEGLFRDIKITHKMWTAAYILARPPYADCTADKIMSLVADRIISEQMVYAAMEGYGYHWVNELWKIRQPGWVQSIRNGDL